MPYNILPHALAFAALLSTLGCTADLGRGGSDGKGFDSGSDQGPDGSNSHAGTDSGKLSISRSAVEAACAERQGELGVGVTKLRRLSVLEFNNTVQSVLGGPYVDYSADLPDDEPMGPFVSNQSLAVGSQEARQYRTVAELVADSALSGDLAWLPCPLPSGDETACIEQFIDEIGPRAFRRPLEEGEAQGLLDIYILGKSGVDGQPTAEENGLRLLLRAIFGSPDLLYIVDSPASGVPSDVPEPVSAHTLASRLTLALWNAPPDAELEALAASGEILDDEVFAAQVERVLADPRAEQALVSFFSQLTGVDELHEKEKDPALFPQFTPELVQQMLDEQAGFVRDVVFQKDGRLSTLLTTNFDSPGSALASLYGTTAPPGEPVVLPAGQRQGLFTQAAYLAAHNKAAETSPVHLGINIREAILCETIPSPPVDVDTTLPEVEGEIRTSRDRFLLHETGPCKSCHELIDPIGLAFEHYDAIGTYRLTDNGAEIDPTGQIIAVGGGEDGPMFTGALELSDQLADSVQVRDCVSRQMLRAALDRQESLLDACTALEVVEGFDGSFGNLRQLLSFITKTEAFKHVVLNPPETNP